VATARLYPSGKGKPYPTTKQHAILVKAPRPAATLRLVRPLRYSMLGQLAAIGRQRGVAIILGLRFSGFTAWFLWRSAYLIKLPVS
jgi:NADH dehydrogenase